MVQIRDPARLAKDSNSQTRSRNDSLGARQWRERGEDIIRNRADPGRGRLPLRAADDDDEEEEEEEEEESDPLFQQLSEEEQKLKKITEKHEAIYSDLKRNGTKWPSKGSLEDCFKDADGNKNAAEFENFVKSHRDYFEAVGKNQENLLHYLAKQKKGRALVRWLHGQWPGLALQKDAAGNTPLYSAIITRQKWFVLTMLESSDSSIEILGAVGENGNTVHRILEDMIPVDPDLVSALKVALENQLATSADSSFGDVLRCRNNEGQTPLHVAINLISHPVMASPDDRAYRKTLINFARDLVVMDPSILQEPNRDGYTPLHLALKTVGDGQFRRTVPTSAGLGSWICDMIDLSPDAFLVKTSILQSPYHLLGSARDDKACETLVEEMKRFYIRVLPNEELKELLYSQWDDETGSTKFLSQTEKRVYFDLSTTLETNLTYEYFQSLSQHVRFETILHHVDLPSISVQKGDNWFKRGPEFEERFKAIRDLTGVGRADFPKVFMWLRNNGVQKILDIHAVDSFETPHCDEAIELSIQGFQVEILNWERVDISSDVFYNAAPDVRELYLYSSGNNEILRGWSSRDGLPRLKKLKKITLNVRMGSCTETRMKGYVEAFKERMWKEIPGLEIADGAMVVPDTRMPAKKVQRPTATSFDCPIFMHHGKLMIYSTHRWLNCIEEFVREVKTYHKDFTSRMPSVKVAIIDDGINASQFDNHTSIAGGTSFQCHHNRPDRPLDYWASTGTHGTEMAKMVQRICPVAELYIIRLGEGTGERGIRQIRVETAMKAIEWATNAGVDIISMSWSINRNSVNQETYLEFDNCIRKAYAQDITMFCSATDQGQTQEASSDSYMPAMFSDPLKIGASTPEGGKWSFTGSQKVDFYLPGVDIPVADKAGVVRFEQGSSFATAIAAGLAALLRYCIGIAIYDGNNTPVLRTVDMKHAFHKLCSTHREIPEVGELFKDAGSLDTRFKMLERYQHIAACLRQ